MHSVTPRESSQDEIRCPRCAASELDFGDYVPAAGELEWERCDCDDDERCSCPVAICHDCETLTNIAALRQTLVPA